MFQKILMFLFFTKTAAINCNYEVRNLGFSKESQDVYTIGQMPSEVNESSGITTSPWSHNLLTVNDSGGETIVYEINREGVLQDKHAIPDAKNRDWEEITSDSYGNIYIGDFGNNKSKRKNLTIYKFSNGITEEITFSFADQTFEENEKNVFDCEAFFWYNDSLYLFTKSWEPGIKTGKLYILPDQPGDYIVPPRDDIKFKAQITGAAVSPDQKKYALIAYGKIFIFGIKDGQISFKRPQTCIKINKKQTEAIMFENENTLLFTNEQGGIFRMNLNKF